MKDGYRILAPFYDRLSQVVFKRAQKNAQIQQLKYLSRSKEILICGGGTGWILKELAKVEPANKNIMYLDVSAAMIRMAGKCNSGSDNVTFIQTDILGYQPDRTFDVILTSFFFDNFSRENVLNVFNKLDQCLKPGGLWLFNDFSLEYGNGKWWKKVLLRTMYLFFQIITGLNVSSLVDVEPLYLASGYAVLDRKLFYNAFILSMVYQKPDSINFVK